MNGYLLHAWRVWDFFYYYSSRLQFVDKRKNLFRVVVLPYRGPELRTKSGRSIRRGDPILKLHIHNFRLAELLHAKKGAKALGIVALREVRDSLPGLARYLAQHPMRDQIRGLVGTTFLHRGAESLGFTTEPAPPTLWYRVKTWYLKWLLRLMHPEGKDRLKQKEECLSVKKVFMAKEELFALYLQDSFRELRKSIR